MRQRQIPLLGSYIAPRTQTEQKLTEIWCSAFGMDEISITDTYYDFGGDSLLAASIFVEIEKTFCINVELSLLIEAPTVAQLAARIDLLMQGAE